MTAQPTSEIVYRHTRIVRIAHWINALFFLLLLPRGLQSFNAHPMLYSTMLRFAPTRTALTGAAAGLLAGGASATICGLHCDENTASFVAVWYSLGIAFTVITGAIVGSRALRW